MAEAVPCQARRAELSAATNSPNVPAMKVANTDANGLPTLSMAAMWRLMGCTWRLTSDRRTRRSVAGTKSRIACSSFELISRETNHILFA